MRLSSQLRNRVRNHPSFLHVRGWWVDRSRPAPHAPGGAGTLPPLQNVYFPTVQRSGSQWMKAFFSNMRIRRFTGLRPFPQRRYEWGEFVRRFPLYTFVPLLYVSYDLYEEIEKPPRYRTFYVMRDPRSVVVSWYHAMLKTHVLMGKVGRYREDLSRLLFDDGISYCIRALTGKFADMRTWWDHRDDPNVTLLRFEDMIQDPAASMAGILEACGFQVPPPVLADVMRDYTKDSMRKKDPRTEADPDNCHYRATTSDHHEAFTDDHYRLFRDVTGNLVTYLGYEEFDAPRREAVHAPAGEAEAAVPSFSRVAAAAGTPASDT
jgi:hypothetical protein